ncbi:MAG TPA: hypothetical protein VGY54_27950 [Polyangiaceae bacterium]|nr:hypothetical protein [Polyangiaceae bacterium]
MNAARGEQLGFEREPLAREACARKNLRVLARALPQRFGQADGISIDPEPRESRDVALELRPSARLERTVVMEMGPVVQAPEESIEVVGGEPEQVAWLKTMCVKLVGRVVDRPRGERLLGLQPQTECVQARELAGQKIAWPAHHEHGSGRRRIDSRGSVPECGWPAPLELAALTPCEGVEHSRRNDTPEGCRSKPEGTGACADSLGRRGAWHLGVVA